VLIRCIELDHSGWFVANSYLIRLRKGCRHPTTIAD
jgi:hypothetical protein